MSTPEESTPAAADTTPSTPSTPEAGALDPSAGPSASPSPGPALSTLIVAPEMREEFDSRFRAVSGIPTPSPELSEAVVAHDAEGNVAGAIYVAVRHIASPLLLAQEAPANTLTVLTERISERMYEHLGGLVEAQNEESNADPAADSLRQLLYDVYVPEGMTAPDGFERLPVSVWRRRVL